MTNVNLKAIKNVMLLQVLRYLFAFDSLLLSNSNVYFVKCNTIYVYNKDDEQQFTTFASVCLYMPGAKHLSYFETPG